MRDLFRFACIDRFSKLGISDLIHAVMIGLLLLATSFAQTQTFA